MAKREAPIPLLGDDDWLEVAGCLENLAEMIRAIVDDDAPRDTNRRIRLHFRSADAYKLIGAVAAYGKPKGWTENGEAIY